MKNKRGQVTIFIIVAILIVAGIIFYFSFKPGIVSVPKNMEPAYNYYLSCLQESSRQGIALLGEQGGYIEPPSFEPGSVYMPFSSQLDFYGQPVPYWLYVSGNNVMKEQVPTKNDMESQLSKYVKDRVSYCDFSDLEMQGFDVVVGNNPIVSSSISSTGVDVDVKNSVKISFENQTVVVDEQKVSLQSKLGKFYDLALQTYNFEKQNMFLEKYALDALDLYVPTTGVDLTCAPKFFDENQIKSDLRNALLANMNMLKLKGSYYELANTNNKYFETDIGTSVDESVNFIYANNFPYKIEMYGDKVVQPIGLQEGLGILGFCYVPYHLVYDVDFPVLIQFYDSNEIFQFPVAVVVDKNQARTSLAGEAGVASESEVCKYLNQPVEIKTFDSELNPVESRVVFKCMNSECYLGETKVSGSDAVLNANSPQCVNGFLVASAEGYADAKYQISTNVESSANIIMNKMYNLSLNILSNGQSVGNAVIYFNGENSVTVAYPAMKTIQLPEGMYNVSVYVFQNSSLTIPAVASKKCVNVASSGFGAILGMTDEKCFDINIPAQEISNVIIGGGKSQEYITESQLKEGKELNINVPVFKTPASLQDVQDNYIALDDAVVDVNLK